MRLARPWKKTRGVGSDLLLASVCDRTSREDRLHTVHFFEAGERLVFAEFKSALRANSCDTGESHRFVQRSNQRRFISKNKSSRPAPKVASINSLQSVMWLAGVAFGISPNGLNVEVDAFTGEASASAFTESLVEFLFIVRVCILP